MFDLPKLEGKDVKMGQGTFVVLLILFQGLATAKNKDGAPVFKLPGADYAADLFSSKK